MDGIRPIAKRTLRAMTGAFAIGIIGLSSATLAAEITVTLSGQNEIPPVTTPATGTGSLSVGSDKSVSGKVSVSGMSATVAHIHEAAAGSNGAIVIPLTKTSDNAWVVPPGARLTDAQYESYRAGKLYFNVHSEAHKSGEVRGQINP